MSNDTTPTKVCSKCGREFPATPEFFYRHKGHRDGLLGHCKQCRNKLSAVYKRQWRKDNIERVREQDRQSYRADPEKVREKQRKWAKSHPEKIRERKQKYQRSHPEKALLYVSRRRARKQNLPNAFTDEQWFACLEYFNYCCAVCGNQLRDLFGDVEPNADHWIPIAYQGDDNPGTVATNMICLCSDCNRSKNATMPDEWLKWKFGKSKAEKILKQIRAYFEWVVSQ